MKQGLGRGLGSLIPPKENQFSPLASIAASQKELQDAATVKIVDIPIDSIDPNPLQPRQYFDDRTLEELVSSIRSYGLLEPIVVTSVRERWQLVAGERRLRAFRLLGRSTIPAIIRSASELEQLELSLIENIQREDLNPIERANAFAKLINDFGLTQEEAAKKIGIPRSTLANSIRLLDLPSEIQMGLAARKISEGHGKVLLSLKTKEEQMRLYHELTRGKAMSVEQLRTTIERLSTARPKKEKTTKNYELRSLEDRLQSRLGTKVTIKTKPSGVRHILIETYSDEEFREVVKTICAL